MGRHSLEIGLGENWITSFLELKGLLGAQKESEAPHSLLPKIRTQHRLLDVLLQEQSGANLGRKFPNKLFTSSGLGKQKPLWVPVPQATARRRFNCCKLSLCPLFIFSLLRLFLVHFKCLHTFLVRRAEQLLPLPLGPALPITERG